MKQIAIGMISIIVIILFVGIYLNLMHRQSRKEEVTNNLAEAIEISAEQAWLDREKLVKNDKEFVSDFIQTLVMQMESESSVDIRIVEVDLEKGILAVDVKETFQYTNGKEGTVDYQKTILLEREIKKEIEMCSVIFYCGNEDKDEEIFKIYEVEKNGSIVKPQQVIDYTDEKRKFNGWIDENGKKILDKQIQVARDIKYYASYI